MNKENLIKKIEFKESQLAKAEKEGDESASKIYIDSLHNDIARLKAKLEKA